MPEQPVPSGALAPTLAERLQDIMEALPATSTSHDVFIAVLPAALQALDATAGAVLLVNAAGDRLRIAATRGHGEDAQSVWPDGPRTGDSPAWAALERRAPLFFEGVATAVLPMFEQAEPLGVLVLDFKAPHLFTEGERWFLRILAAQCALALGRARREQDLRALNAALESREAERAQQVEENARAHEAFVAFTEAVGTQTDLLDLARQAIAVLRARFTDASIGYYTRDAALWKMQVWSDDMDDALVARLRAGLPNSTPFVRGALETGTVFFTDGWDPQREQIEHSENYGSAASYPLVVGGEVRHLLLCGLKDTRRWSARDKALVRAVGRGLSLALERAEQTRQLHLQKDEVEQRNRALSAFAELTRDLDLRSDPHRLIRRAQEVVLSLLPPGFAVYCELEDGRWFVKSQVVAFREPGLQAAADRGFPFDFTPNLTTPWITRRPYYQDDYDPAADHLAELAWEVGTTAVLPVMVDGEPVGVFATVLFERRGWTPTEKGVLETVVRSLGLALEGARGVVQLTEERRKLGAANEELEAFTYSVSHDLRTPVRHIVGFTDLLGTSLQGRLDDKQARYLKVIKDAGARMNTLIDAMLDLARSARLPLRLEPVDLGAVVADIQAELESDLEGRTVRWAVAPLPVVLGDADTLRQVMINLLSNALKYTRLRDVAEIWVWAENRSQEWAVCVRDNGVGFDPRYQERLFGVFQRLHRAEEFEGTGVGLANVRRIIERHGGTVWAHSEEGRGATFAFSIPRSL